jgi:membrane fusion protein, multidrug efflux system
VKNTASSKKKTILILFALGLILFLGATIFRQFTSKTGEATVPEKLARPVKTVCLEERSLFETRSFPGLVRAASETKLAFRVDGPLVQFHVGIGQRVSEGDTIARIDPRDFEVRVTRLSARLNGARANLKAMKKGARAEDIALLEARLKADKALLLEAENQHKRYEALAGGKIVSQSEYDHVKAAFETAGANRDATLQELKKARAGSRKEDIEAANARINSLRADLNAAKHALKDTRLKAPFTGIVNRQYVENHEYVKAGAPIVSLLDFSVVEVHTSIPEDLVIRPAQFDHILCTLDAYQGRPLKATVKEMGRKTDSANQSYPLKVMLQIPKEMAVEPGMAATVNITLKDPEQKTGDFMLPSGAVFADGSKRSAVWRIDPQTMQVVKTPIEIGKLQGDTVQIRSGLKGGDCVVATGTRYLREGQTVRILNRENRS